LNDSDEALSTMISDCNHMISQINWKEGIEIIFLDTTTTARIHLSGMIHQQRFTVRSKFSDLKTWSAPPCSARDWWTKTEKMH